MKRIISSKGNNYRITQHANKPNNKKIMEEIKIHPSILLPSCLLNLIKVSVVLYPAFHSRRYFNLAGRAFFGLIVVFV